VALKRIPIPVRIDLEDEGRRIHLVWPDGSGSELSAFDLRSRCPCAGCVDEMTGRRILDPADVAPRVAATAFGRVGRYAVQFTWSDGHSTGIYSYEKLADWESTSAPAEAPDPDAGKET
jgi:ATP-binding protein involved in chromosome partitioning